MGKELKKTKRKNLCATLRLLCVSAVKSISVVLLILTIARAEEGLKKDGAKLGPELLSQGDFESGKKGKKTLDGWDEVDDLTSFHVKRNAKEGKCLKFDSDVYNKEVKARKKEMKLPEKKRPKAKPKTKTTGKKYNTVAGGKGALLWSDYIEIESGATYRLVAEVKTYAPEVLIFVKAYREVKGKRRSDYKARLVCMPEDKNELGQWKLYSRDLTIQHKYNKKLKYKWIKVMIMVFWPPGDAYVDNISIRKIVKPGKKNNKKGGKPQAPARRSSETTKKDGSTTPEGVVKGKPKRSKK